MLSYNHTQVVPATVWTVVHNFGTSAVATDAIIVTGGNQEKILPANVVMTDSNTLTIIFSTNQTGTARVVSG